MVLGMIQMGGYNIQRGTFFTSTFSPMLRSWIRFDVLHVACPIRETPMLLAFAAEKCTRPPILKKSHSAGFNEEFKVV